MGKNWSISFEHEEYEGNRDLIIEEAMEAVEKTSEGYYVNLVTPDVFGHPESYLKEVLESQFKDAIKMKYIDQCGCGGYVLRVWKKE